MEYPGKTVNLTRKCCLAACNMNEIEVYIMVVPLLRTGHNVRMSAVRLPSAILYSKLSDGACKVGALKMRFKDQLKKLLSKCDITDFEVLANDRGLWKTAFKTGVVRFEKAQTEDSSLLRGVYISTRLLSLR